VKAVPALLVALVASNIKTNDEISGIAGNFTLSTSVSSITSSYFSVSFAPVIIKIPGEFLYDSDYACCIFKLL
jgi:ABC-type uncharacterized transport system permease subunit